MGTVISYDPITWKTMLMVKNSISWYEEQEREDSKYSTAKKKERKILRNLMEEGFAT